MPRLILRLNPSFPWLFPAARLPARLQKLMMPGEEKLKAEIAELRTMAADADATLNSLVVELANTQAEIAKLRGASTPKA